MAPPMTLLQSFASLAERPIAGDRERVATGLQNWSEQTAGLADPKLAAFAQDLLEDPAGRCLLEAIFANSPYLSHCAIKEIACLRQALSSAPEVVLGQVIAGLKDQLSAPGSRAEVMQKLRIARRQTALVVALTDMAGLWSLEQVTGALSRLADASLDLAAAHLLLEAAGRGELILNNPELPLEHCGYVLLAMGKLGAFELNYSSDIDLIVLYDLDKVDYRGSKSPQDAFVRITRDMVTILSEPTVDGFAFRTDLRLRPDPGATPIAISVNAALSYYESMGQNWERAAMIKARPAAGDVALGRSFVDELRPFVWRKHLDFWAIQDIHSIKRQINAHKGGDRITLAGHNVKLGRGGIREIEFFAQTQQLIFGGRDPSLRIPQTLAALDRLVWSGRIERGAAERLDAAYRYLRRVEHRLQMVEDQQTHDLPSDPAALSRLANFLGHDLVDDFAAEITGHMAAVEEIYADLFEEAPALSGPGNLVFTGGEPDPATLETLESLGYRDGAAVFEQVRSWHHGRYRATRSTRSREILTELMPSLLEAFGKTLDPDGALVRFSEFLGKLPAGVQLFSLIQANPLLLDLLAEIMGRAPALANHLGRNPGLLDAVLSSDFFEPPPETDFLRVELEAALTEARDFQDTLDISRRWANDRRFQAGVQSLRHAADVEESGHALSAIAETAIAGLYLPVLKDLMRRHGAIQGPGLAVLALGKLGSREMTAASDLDLIFIYEAGDSTTASDGDKPLAASQYFARFAQRLINALSAPTGEGLLYEVDMRLRPSGNAGPIAVSLAGFERYHEAEAWTWEHMALTRARVIQGDPGLAARIEEVIRGILCRPRDPDRLVVDVAEMRARIARSRPPQGPWDVKDQRGGLVDGEFIAQYLQLKHAAERPELLAVSAEAALRRIGEAGLLAAGRAERLVAAMRRYRAVQGFLRLTAGRDFDESTAPEGLRAALARAAETDSFEQLKADLSDDFATVCEAFTDLVETPALARGASLEAAQGEAG